MPHPVYGNPRWIRWGGGLGTPRRPFDNGIASPVAGRELIPMQSSSRADRWIGLGIFSGLLLVTLAWSAYTQHVWEDFFITYRASKNLALGNGLVFTVGERIQTFTSPLQALIPAALAWLTRCRSDDLVIWLYRIIGGCALGGCGYSLWLSSRYFRWPAAATLGCIGLFALDAKTIDFTASGMETPYLLFFMAWQAYIVFTGGSTRWLGVAWAGMMMSRPDAFIQIAAFYAGVVLFADERASRRDLVIRAIRAGLLTAVLYLPWFAWASWYYGSPVPHTIIAKGLHSPSGAANIFHSILEAPQQVVIFGLFHRILFAPTYLELGPWREWGYVSHTVWRLLALPVWFYWLNPWGGRWARTASLWLFLGSIYAVFAPPAPWYIPPYTLVAIIAWGFVIADLAERMVSNGNEARVPRIGVLRLLLPCLVLGVVFFQAGTSLTMANTMRLQQAIIEGQNRKPIGLWLHQVAAPGDTVFLEPLGYIGYYSNLKMLDFPGLVSNEVVNARRKLGTDEYSTLIRELKPVWVVLRPADADHMKLVAPGLLSEHGQGEYGLARTYDQSATVAALGDLRGRSFIAWDQTFLIYHRMH
jgi:hypothetical protein